MDTKYRIAGYFRRVFIFGYFEEALFCENKFPGPTVIRKYILTIKLNACLHSRDYIIFAARMNALCSFIDISSGCQIQKAQIPKHCPQILIRPLMKLCMLAARRFETS